MMHGMPNEIARRWRIFRDWFFRCDFGFEEVWSVSACGWSIGWLVSWLLGSVIDWFVWLVGCLIGWLVGLMVRRFIGWLIDLLFCGLVDWCIDWLPTQLVCSSVYPFFCEIHNNRSQKCVCITIRTYCNQTISAIYPVVTVGMHCYVTTALVQYNNGGDLLQSNNGCNASGSGTPLYHSTCSFWIDSRRRLPLGMHSLMLRIVTEDMLPENNQDMFFNINLYPFKFNKTRLLTHSLTPPSHPTSTALCISTCLRSKFVSSPS